MTKINLYKTGVDLLSGQIIDIIDGVSARFDDLESLIDEVKKLEKEYNFDSQEVFKKLNGISKESSLSRKDLTGLFIKILHTGVKEADIYEIIEAISNASLVSGTANIDDITKAILIANSKNNKPAEFISEQFALAFDKTGRSDFYKQFYELAKLTQNQNYSPEELMAYLISTIKESGIINDNEISIDSVSGTKNYKENIEELTNVIGIIEKLKPSASKLTKNRNQQNKNKIDIPLENPAKFWSKVKQEALNFWATIFGGLDDPDERIIAIRGGIPSLLNPFDDPLFSNAWNNLKQKEIKRDINLDLDKKLNDYSTNEERQEYIENRIVDVEQMISAAEQILSTINNNDNLPGSTNKAYSKALGSIPSLQIKLDELRKRQVYYSKITGKDNINGSKGDSYGVLEDYFLNSNDTGAFKVNLDKDSKDLVDNLMTLISETHEVSLSVKNSDESGLNVGKSTKREQIDLDYIAPKKAKLETKDPDCQTLEVEKLNSYRVEKQEEAERLEKEKKKEERKEKIAKLGTGLKGASDVLGDMSGLVGMVDEKAGKTIAKAGEIAGNAATLAAGIASGNPVQIIQGSIKLLTNVVSLFGEKEDEIWAKRKEQNLEIAKRLKLENAINEKLYERLRLQNESLFLGADFEKTLVNGLREMDKESKLLGTTMGDLKKGIIFTAEGEAKRKLFGKKKGTYSFSLDELLTGKANIEGPSTASRNAQRDAFKNLQTSFSSVLSQMGYSLSEFSTLSNEEMLDVFKLMEEGGYVTDEGSKQMLANATVQLELYKQAKEAVEATIKEMAGNLGSSLGDSLVEGFERGTDAAESFKDSVEDILEELIKQQIINTLFRDNFDQLEEEMKDSYGEDGDQDWKDDLTRFYEGIRGEIELANEMFSDGQEWGAENGFDLFTSDESKSGLTGAVRRELTEETGSELAGLMRKMSDDGRMARDYNAIAVNHLSAVETNTYDTVVQLQYAVAKLTTIATNTTPTLVAG